MRLWSVLKVVIVVYAVVIVGGSAAVIYYGLKCPAEMINPPKKKK